MEVIPGQGVESVLVGDRREDVERRLGPELNPSGRDRALYAPNYVVTYTDGIVELVELACCADEAHQPTLDGVRLVDRPLEHVLTELAARGYTSTPTDIGCAFHAGFAVFTMGSHAPEDFGDGDVDEDTQYAEGVAIAPYSYFTG